MRLCFDRIKYIVLSIAKLSFFYRPKQHCRLSLLQFYISFFLPLYDITAQTLENKQKYPCAFWLDREIECVFVWMQGRDTMDRYCDVVYSNAYFHVYIHMLIFTFCSDNHICCESNVVEILVVVWWVAWWWRRRLLEKNEDCLRSHPENTQTTDCSSMEFWDTQQSYTMEDGIHRACESLSQPKDLKSLTKSLHYFHFSWCCGVFFSFLFFHSLLDFFFSSSLSRSVWVFGGCILTESRKIFLFHKYIRPMFLHTHKNRSGW